MSKYIEIFRDRLGKAKISQKQLAEAAGRSQNNISEILNGKVSPSVDSFELLLDSCDRLQPGFKDEYVRALLGEKVDLQKFVYSLNSAELGMLLMFAGPRVSERAGNRQLVAA
jgi:transcriptional regulator with XRE-family HTH domain